MYAKFEHKWEVRVHKKGMETKQFAGWLFYQFAICVYVKSENMESV